MFKQSKSIYDRIELAIDFINRNFKQQPSLDEIASAVGISSFYLQRLFVEWCGVSPKKFMQFLSVEYAKEALSRKKLTLLDTAYETGLSGTGRLHDLFVNIEGMTPGEFKNGGQGLTIYYSFAQSPFGSLIIASTAKGVCHMFFEEDEYKAVLDLKTRFPNARYRCEFDDFQKSAVSIFKKDWEHMGSIKLHLKGSEFQLKVWRALLSVPMGELCTYGSISEAIKRPKAYRAVGSAIGKNPVAFLIPCHRVIQASGHFGGYMWGGNRKSAIIAWEAVKD